MKKLITLAAAVVIGLSVVADCASEANTGKCTVSSPNGQVPVRDNTWYALDRKTNQYVVFSWSKDSNGNVTGILAKRVGFSNSNAVAYTPSELFEFFSQVNENQKVDDIIRFTSVSYKNGCLMVIEKKYDEITDGNAKKSTVSADGKVASVAK